MFICLTGTLLFLKRKERNKTTEVLVCSCCSSIFLFRKKDATSPKLSDLSDLLSFTLKGGCKRRAASLRIATVSPWGPSLCTHDKKEFEKDFHVPELHLAFSVFIELSLILLLRNGASDAVRWCKKKIPLFHSFKQSIFLPSHNLQPLLLGICHLGFLSDKRQKWLQGHRHTYTTSPAFSWFFPGLAPLG